MPSFEYHCQESEKLFGSPHSEVHIWLDEFAGSKKYGMRHRRVRHHLSGIDEVRRLWSDNAAEAARSILSPI